jgi:DNA helicase-2/ATP-dependent DNA helicase PcrA
MDILRHLNQPQQHAVQHGEGPLLVLAGAGSGKTRVIVHRIAWLIQQHGVRPWQILAVTFTNKAAGEMRERVEKLLGGTETPLIATFHATCVRILRREIGRLGFGGNFVIYDDKESERLLKDVLIELNIDEKKYPAKAFAAAIDECKNAGSSPLDLSTGDQMAERLVRVYAAYQERLKKCNALDFGDLLLYTVRIFEEFPEVLAQYRDKWQWLLVDEYQDTNPIQYRLVSLLAGERRNLCVVGDDDQSLARRRYPQYTRFRAGFSRRDRRQAGAELSLDQQHPQRCRSGGGPQPGEESEDPLDRESAGGEDSLPAAGG